VLLLMKWINKEARILPYYIFVIFYYTEKRFLSVIGFLLHRYGLYIYIYIYIYAFFFIPLDMVIVTISDSRILGM
jgi:hypothetical protein